MVFEFYCSLLFVCCRYAALYFKMLPDSILGEAFLDQYSDHSDPVTIIDKKRTYGVRAAARHPIYETFRVKVCNSMLGTFFEGWLGPLNLHRGSYCSIYPCSLEKNVRTNYCPTNSNK